MIHNQLFQRELQEVSNLAYGKIQEYINRIWFQKEIDNMENVFEALKVELMIASTKTGELTHRNILSQQNPNVYPSITRPGYGVKIRLKKFKPGDTTIRLTALVYVVRLDKKRYKTEHARYYYKKVIPEIHIIRIPPCLLHDKIYATAFAHVIMEQANRRINDDSMIEFWSLARERKRITDQSDFCKGTNWIWTSDKRRMFPS